MSDDLLLADQYQGPVLYETDTYSVQELRVKQIASDMKYVWNYAVTNKRNGVIEVRTDSLPGAVSLALKLEDGLEQITKLLQEREAEKQKKLIQAENRERALSKRLN